MQQDNIKKIGIIGGGQLCRFMAKATKEKNLPFSIIALDPNPNCPASKFVDKLIVGELKGGRKIKELAEASNIVTFEVEFTNSETLKALEKEGHAVFPAPGSLNIIQDKLEQNQFLDQNGFPTPRHWSINNKDELKEKLKALGNHGILKSRFDAYDGKGNFIIKPKNDSDQMEMSVLVEKAWDALARGKSQPQLMLEELIDFQTEVSVVVSRNPRGQENAYPLIENLHDHSVLIRSIVPARVNAETAFKAIELAKRIVDKLSGVGVFTVEMFVTKCGDVLVNEIAPRVHNSGHFSLDASPSSQFEQHLYAISNLPLPSIEPARPAVMFNLLGPEGYSGPYQIIGAEKIKEEEGAFLHMYEKETSSTRRKLGHFTYCPLNSNNEDILKKASALRDCLEIVPI